MCVLRRFAAVLLCVFAACACACAGTGSAQPMPSSADAALPSLADSSSSAVLPLTPGDDMVVRGSSSAPKESGGAALAADAPHVRKSREQLMQMMIDPPADIDISSMKASDFGDFFTQSHKVTVSEKKLLADTEYETKMVVIEGAESGPTVFVVAGLHGDETAGWSAGNLLQDVTIKAGRLCVISPANSAGARNKSRYAVDKQDINRSFPGSGQKNAGERIANAIYGEIKAQDPKLLLDLHEARILSNKGDYLGSSLIYTELFDAGDMLLDMLFDTQTGDLCSEPFETYTPAPQGSVNRTVSENLKIPAITVETFRGYPLNTRIADQLDIVQYVLNYCGML